MSTAPRQTSASRAEDSRHTNSVRRKGLGSCSAITSAGELRRLNLGWYYNWKPVPDLPPVPGVEFVPMFWSVLHLTPDNLAAVDASNATHVLGFNEPDMNGQANMSPGGCLACWPRLMELRQRLGSPAPANSDWLDEFMPAAKRRGLRVDFVCLHRYPDISNPGAVDEVENMLIEAHRKYRLPIWLTECGAADVSAWNQPQVARPTAAMARDFLARLLPMLDRLPFVERYAWFADRVGAEYRFGSLFGSRAGRLTPIGRMYQDHI